MKQKLLLLFLALALCLTFLPLTASADVTEYDLWLGGVRVTSENCEDITAAILAAHPNAASGIARYYPARKTLLLADFTYTGPGHEYTTGSFAALYACPNSAVVIVLRGENALTCNKPGAESFGIRVSYDTRPSDTYDLRISSCGDLCVNAQGSTAHGIAVNGNLEINSANVTATAQSDSGGSAYGLSMLHPRESNITMDSAGMLTCRGETRAIDYIKTNALLTLNSTENVLWHGSLFNGSDATQYTGSRYVPLRSLGNDRYVKVDCPERRIVTVILPEGARFPGDGGFSSTSQATCGSFINTIYVEVENNNTHVFPEDYTFDCGDPGMVVTWIDESTITVSGKPAADTTIHLPPPEQIWDHEDGSLWVGGVQVTDENASDLVAAIGSAASGSARYDKASNTLFLENFRFSGAGRRFVTSWGRVQYAVIYSNRELCIQLSGDCALVGSAPSAQKDSYGIYSQNDLSFVGPGSLLAAAAPFTLTYGNNDDRYRYTAAGICTTRALSVTEGAKVSARGGDMIAEIVHPGVNEELSSYGLYADQISVDADSAVQGRGGDITLKDLYDDTNYSSESRYIYLNGSTHGIYATIADITGEVVGVGGDLYLKSIYSGYSGEYYRALYGKTIGFYGVLASAHDNRPPSRITGGSFRAQGGSLHMDCPENYPARGTSFGVYVHKGFSTLIQNYIINTELTVCGDTAAEGQTSNEFRFFVIGDYRPGVIFRVNTENSPQGAVQIPPVTQIPLADENNKPYKYFSIEPQPAYTVQITPGANMTPTANSGEASQNVPAGSPITDLQYKANQGYCFPADYASLGTVNGITVQRDHAGQITVFGTPTANTSITLAAAVAMTQEPMPNAVFSATGADTGLLSGLVDGGHYTVTGGQPATFTAVGAMQALHSLSPGTLTLVKKGDGSLTADSDGQAITVTKASTPHLTATQPAAAGGTGSIPTDASHEISRDGTAYLPCAGPSSELAEGTYFVRVAASGSVLASEAQRIVIAHTPSGPRFTLSFAPNGGMGSMASAEDLAPGTVYTLPDNGFTPPEGKQFRGWQIQGNTYPAGGSYTVNADTTAAALWEVIPPRLPASGAFSGTKSIRINAPVTSENVKIYYTTDGTTPNHSSTAYTGPFEIKATTTVKAVTILGGTESSTVSSATYTRKPEVGHEERVTYRLYFETNGGSAIASIKRDAETVIQLAAYTPKKDGYVFDGWYADKALTKPITKVKLTKNTTVYAKWKELEKRLPFADVKKGDYFFDAVYWGVEKDITSGVSSIRFNPDGVCTRGQMVTFLWRTAGRPTPTADIPFIDVPANAYYFDAVRWAYGKGITLGTGPVSFSPDQTVSRSQVAALLYRYSGSPAVENHIPFTDVPGDAYYFNAVRWATEMGITQGITATAFHPAEGCTRAQIMTFLWRMENR